MPLRYVDGRAKIATQWYQVLTFPLQWTAGQVSFPPAGDRPDRARARARAAPEDDAAGFARRYVTMLALGPFAITTLVALVLGGSRSRCGAIRCGRSRRSPRCSGSGSRATRCGCGATRPASSMVFVAMPLAYVIVEGFEPLVRDRPKATQFPGRQLAAT